MVRGFGISVAMVFVLVAVESWAQFPPPLRCQRSLALGARRFEGSVLRWLSLCHTRRMAGAPDFPASLDCNSVGALPTPWLKRLLVSESSWGQMARESCNAVSAPADLGYSACPPPCESMSIGSFSEVVSCLGCLARDKGEREIELLYGSFPNPSVLPDQLAERSCQQSLGHVIRALFAVRLGEQVRCEVGFARGTTPPNTDCRSADLQGRIARKQRVVERLIRRRCSDTALQNLSSCADTTDGVVSCTIGGASRLADELFDAVFVPRGRTPTPSPTATVTRSPTMTPTRTATTTETPTATVTPTPSHTPVPTATLSPTHTWPPGVPTYTPTETPTASPTPESIVKTCSFGAPETRLGLQWDKLIFTLPLGRTLCSMSGQFELVFGPEDAQGRRTVAVPASSVTFDPVVCNVANVQNTTICVESPGADGFGVTDCNGGSSDYNFSLAVDHNTNGAPQSNGGFPQDQSCTSTYTDPITGELWHACLEQSGGTCNLNNLHPGVCNSPYRPEYAGVFPAGGITLRLPLRLKNVAQATGNPCDGNGDTYNVTTEFTAFLTTGVARGTVYDANNADRKIDQGAPCYGGNCVTEVTGTPATAFCADPQASLSGTKLVTVLTVIDLHSLAGDAVATVELQCQ